MPVNLTIGDVTDGTLNGTGIFDKLMDVVTAHVEDQYEKGRIIGGDYATVYLGSMQSVIAQSIQYALQNQLVAAQVDSTVSATTELIANGVINREKLNEEIDLLQTQDSELIANGVINREKLNEEIDLLQTQDSELIANGAADRANKTKQGLQIDAQTATAVKQALLIERQTKGFDDDAKQKLLKQTLDSWSVAYSVAKDANAIPDTIKVNVVDSVMKNAMDALSISVTNDPIGEA